MLKYSLIVLIGVGLLLYQLPLGLGWLLGNLCLSILAFVRERFYKELLSDDAFQTRRYVAYIIFVFVILWLPLGVAFVIPNFISAYSLAASYIVDRFLMFLKGGVARAS